MKKIAVLLVVVISALMMMVATASAQPSTYDSGFQVQNLGSGPANVNITFYKQDGSVEAQVNDTIAAGSSHTYFPLPTDVSSGFDGSVVIASDQPVAAITNVLGDGFDYGASYGGFSGGAADVNLPLIMKNNGGFATWFNVQNTGASPASVTVSYAKTSCTESASIQPGAAHTFDQATNACLGSSYVGAASVSAGSGEIVATVMETGQDTLFAYNGFTSGSATPVMPLVQFNNAGYTSGIQIQNTGSTSSNITLSYSPAAGAPGTACTETLAVDGGASGTFGLYAFSLNGPKGTTNCVFGSKFVGSATVTANSASNELVAIVNQTNFKNYGSAYNGFDPATATGSLVMPLIMDRNSGFYTGFNLMNVGSASANVTCTFSGSSITVSQTLAAGAAMNDLQLNKIANKYVGSANCTAAGGSIIAVVNELGNSTASDLLFTYEAFNQ